jgi:hypothetical protein
MRMCIGEKVKYNNMGEMGDEGVCEEDDCGGEIGRKEGEGE